jgi:hypothetical protein
MHHNLSIVLYMLVKLLILICVCAGLIYTARNDHVIQTAGSWTNPTAKTRLSGNAPFSLIDTHMGTGVKGTYANIINGPDETKQMIKPTSTPLITYYGHGIPLYPVQPGKFDQAPMSPHHLNPKCSPDCCPSPYSCDKGCLCVDQKGLRAY